MLSLSFALSIVQATAPASEDAWDKTSVLASVLLVFVGALGVLYAIKTLRQIRNQVSEMAAQRNVIDGQLKIMQNQVSEMQAQSDILRESVNAAKENADAARDNALAAKVSADALINSARAWVMVEVDWSFGQSGVLQSTSLSQGNETKSTMVNLRVTCLNIGNAFARITHREYVAKIVGMLPGEPDFSEITKLNVFTHYLKPSTQFTEDISAMCDGHLELGMVMVFYGRVRYEDAFGKDHETLFGYTVSPDRALQRLPGTSQYNRHT